MPKCINGNAGFTAKHNLNQFDDEMIDIKARLDLDSSFTMFYFL